MQNFDVQALLAARILDWKPKRQRESATDGVHLFAGQWEDVDCWTLKSFSSRGIERRVDFSEGALLT
jgi:hypothetical protein